MEENNRLNQLIQQKEALAGRSDLTSDEKDQMARRIRREIRKLKAESGDTSTASSAPRRSRSKREVGLPGEIRSATKNPAEFIQFKAEVQEYLTDLGLECRDPSDLIHDTHPAHGFDLVYIYEHDVTGDQLIEKFRSRWANKDPKWFSVSGQDTAEILLLGPLPAAMVQG